MSKTYPPLSFADELENFRVEEESAQQYFLGYLSLQRIPGSNDQVLDRLNDHPAFWITVRFSLLVSTFVTLGRVFDQDRRSVHNIDRLLRVVSENLAAFSRQGLRDRRISEGMNPEFAASYVATKHDLTAEDVRSLRKAVGHWRRLYEARYRDIRHLVFAHRGVKRIEIDALMAKAKIDEMLNLLEFFDALHSALWELWHNGTKPVLSIKPIRLPPDPILGGGGMPGERIYRDAMNVMYEMLDVK